MMCIIIIIVAHDVICVIVAFSVDFDVLAVEHVDIKDLLLTMCIYVTDVSTWQQCILNLFLFPSPPLSLYAHTHTR